MDDLIVLQTNGLAGTLGHGSYLPTDFAEEIIVLIIAVFLSATVDSKN